MNRRIVIALLGIVLAAAMGSGLFAMAMAEADGAEAPVATALAVGELATVDLDGGEAEFSFVAPSGSVYDVWLFPAGEGEPRVSARLWRGERLVGEGEGGMPALSLRLTAGAEYRLQLSGSGQVRLELARHALSRCFALPMVLQAGGDPYSKAFARQGDAHWYALDADSAMPVWLRGVPARRTLRLGAMLYDDGGRLLAEATHTPGGACLLSFTPEVGRRYFIRLSSEDLATGLYELTLSQLTGEALPERVTLSRRSLTLEGREIARLKAEASPDGAGGGLYWESSEPAVALVDSQGVVYGRGAGTAVVTAYAPGGTSDFCAVTVQRVAVTGVALLSHQLTLSVGDDAAIECDVQPGNATDTRLSYEALPQGIVEVDGRGVLRGVAEGTATVTVQSADGGFSDALTVQVNPAPRRWRALLVGEQNYAEGVAAVRTGSVNSVSAMRSMLENLSFNGAKYQVDTLLDATRDDILAGIKHSFSEAGSRDMTLFYITCHGYYAGGVTCLQMYDGSVLTAQELAGALRTVQGDILVVIDCCGSGGAIGRASSSEDILKGIDRVFGGALGPAPMATSRFRVLASAALEQESYRVSFGRKEGESGMATVLARALCAAGGWDINLAARTAMRADGNTNGQVTLNELHAYVARQVMYYLREAGRQNGAASPYAYVQSVQVWPEGDGLVVMQR